MILQEEEIKNKASKVEQAEQRLTTLNLELKVSFHAMVCYVPVKSQIVLSNIYL